MLREAEIFTCTERLHCEQRQMIARTTKKLGETTILQVIRNLNSNRLNA